jgi:hypothetical protein
MSINNARAKLLVLFVPALLVLVAVRQIYLAHTQYLTFWKGGGFGMFSSVDPLRNRILRSYLITQNGEFLLSNYPAGDIEYLVSRATSIPNDKNLTRLARSIAAKKWVLQAGRVRSASVGRPLDDSASMNPPESMRAGDDSDSDSTPQSDQRSEGSSTPIALSAVRLEVWRIRFEQSTSRIIPVKLREMSIPVRSSPASASGAYKESSNLSSAILPGS